MLKTNNAQPTRFAFPRLTRSDAFVALLLTFTVLLGGYFRFIGLNWDDNTRFHPDERFLTINVGSQIGRGYLSFNQSPVEIRSDEEQLANCQARYPDSPNGVGGYFDAECSDMNPHNTGSNGLYVYGTLPLFTAHWVGQTLEQITGGGGWSSGNLHLTWRAISALCDALVVLMVFFIGQRLHGKWTGLLAAFLYACAVLPIQIAHFGTADAMTNLWVAMTFLFLVRAQDNGTLWDYALCGAAFGVALASRVNIAPLVIAIIFAAAVRILPALDNTLPRSERWRAFTYNFGGLVLAGGVTLLVFRIFNPYAFLGPG
ncbi:MAG: glycosyltransferase family 39 protein, partial [Armatimonadetes bacterium]|nr:glycosyltransferase family 39 protein [Anaerolineae bacterium]